MVVFIWWIAIPKFYPFPYLWLSFRPVKLVFCANAVHGNISILFFMFVLENVVLILYDKQF